jgi:hypothetical protein
MDSSTRVRGLAGVPSLMQVEVLTDNGPRTGGEIRNLSRIGVGSLGKGQPPSCGSSRGKGVCRGVLPG